MPYDISKARANLLEQFSSTNKLIQNRYPDYEVRPISLGAAAATSANTNLVIYNKTDGMIVTQLPDPLPKYLTAANNYMKDTLHAFPALPTGKTDKSVVTFKGGRKRSIKRRRNTKDKRRNGKTRSIKKRSKKGSQ